MAPTSSTPPAQSWPPGFIDIHTHYDAQVFWDPWLTPSNSQGVTSVVGGNCGLSLAPCHPSERDTLVNTLQFVEDMDPGVLHHGVDWSWETYGEYRATLERRGLGLNFTTYVGHTAVRLWVLGEAAYERAATPDEIDAMCRVVADALQAGAIGFSTDRSNFHKGEGGRLVPSMMSSEAELTALLRTAAASGTNRPCAIIVDESGEWIYSTQRSLGCPVTFCQIITYPESSPRQPMAAEQMARQRREFATGADVHPQVTSRADHLQVNMAYPFPFYPVPAFGEGAKTDVEGRRAFYTDPGWRAPSQCRPGRKKVGRSALGQVLRRPSLLGIRSSWADPSSRSPMKAGVTRCLSPWTSLWTTISSTRFQIIFANDDTPLLEEILRTPGCILGLSDGGAHTSQMCDAGLPLDFLASWVRDRALMPLEAGVHKVTGEIANFLGLPDRGSLQVGKAADLVVFGLDDIDPGPLRRVQDLPGGVDRVVADQPKGLRHVMVNGAPILADGRDVRSELDRLPGSFLHG